MIVSKQNLSKLIHRVWYIIYDNAHRMIEDGVTTIKSLTDGVVIRRVTFAK